MKVCALTAGFSPADCTDLGIGGVTGTGYFITYDAWLSASKTTGANNDIANITLTRTGDRAWKFDFTLGAPVLSSPLTNNVGGKSGFMHSAVIFVPTKDPDQKKQFEDFVNYGKGVWVFELDSRESPFQIYGFDAGLKLSAMDELPNDPSQGGGFSMTWSTPADNTLENRLPVTFRDATNSRTATIALLDALETPVI